MGKSTGKRIRDEVMLYALSLFGLEPMERDKKYEWRELSKVVICAIGPYGKEIP